MKALLILWVVLIPLSSTAQDAHVVIDSDNGGFLPPRMTTAARNNIPSPSEGLMVFDTLKNLPYFHNGNNWVAYRTVTGNRGGGSTFDLRDPYLGLNFVIALVGTFPSRNGTDPLLGEVMIFAGNFNPRGWAFCNGQLLSISQHSSLFSLLGTNYGGDGRTTFGLPDLRGRSAINMGTGPGLTNIRLGQKGGAESKILTISNMPRHNHIMTQN